MSMWCLSLCVLFADVTFFQERGEGRGDVLVVDESGSGAPVVPPGLAGIELVDADAMGRTRLDELDPTKPWRIADGGDDDGEGVARVRLPSGRGSVYAYARGEGGARSFGYFVIGEDGAARRILERPAIGAGETPFLPRFAVTPGGSGLLFATRAEAGGDLIEVDLLENTVTLRTAQLPPLEFADQGLTLQREFGAALTRNGLYRFGRRPAAQAQAVPHLPGEAVSWFGADIVTSREGRTLLFVAGESPERAYLFAAGRGGRARRISTTPMEIARAGYLPDFEDGPHMAISPDGTTCAWLSVHTDSRELYMRRVDPASPAPLHVTEEARFSPTLNDSGVITFASPSEIFFLQGEGPVHGQTSITRADLYCADLHVEAGAAQVELVNMTGSSGDLTVPFTEYGWLPHGAGVRYLPAARRLLLFDGFHASLELVDLETEVVTNLLHHVQSVRRFVNAGGRLVVELERAAGVLELHRALASGDQWARIGGLAQEAELSGLTAGASEMVATVEGDDQALVGFFDLEALAFSWHSMPELEPAGPLSRTEEGTVGMSFELENDSWAHVAIPRIGPPVVLFTGSDEAYPLPGS